MRYDTRREASSKADCGYWSEIDMEHVIIGTAGHVDHGKTCLIKALTGIETDRLKEEQKRGITIELGFAWMDLADGQRVGIIDVPGHEKFIKNMLAGAGGIGIVILVVAADEGIMPQTVEHLDILSLLGVKKGVIVITKTELVEPDFLELVQEDIKELAKETFLEDAPVIPVSVYKNQGLDLLKETLGKLCVSLPERKECGCFRLPVDRVFSMKGFGTVITGTLLEGKIKKNQDVVLYPEEIPVKVRSIQVHSKETEEAAAGQRAAVNIPDRKKEEIRRGDVLALEGSLYPTRMADVEVEALKHTKRTIRNGSRVHIYHGTKELLGKIVLMDREELKAGERCFAQLRLEEKTAVKKGDRFVLRFYSPVETIGGGTVLDACPKKRRRNDETALQSFEIKKNGTVEQQLALSALEHRGCFYSLQELEKRSSLEHSEVKKAAKKLAADQVLVRLADEVYIHREELDFYQKKITGFLDEYHKAFPLKEGMGLEEVRSRMKLGENSRFADAILENLKVDKVIKEKDRCISKYSFKIVVKEDENVILNEIIQYYRSAGFAPLTTELYAKDHEGQKKFQAVFASLLNKHRLIRLDSHYCIHEDFYKKAKTAFEELEAKKTYILLGEYRDYLGCSRRIATSILEYFDKTGFTVKTDEGRRLRNPQRNQEVKRNG